MIWAVIPAKPAAEGKSRLAGVLTLAQRIQLNLYLFRRTLGIVCAALPSERVLVVSRDPALLGIAATAGAQPLIERGGNLNQALHQAAAYPPLTGGLLAISTDLPELTPEDLQALLAEPGAVTIAPDRLGKGTNALLTTPAACIPYCFGENSFSLHSAAAAQRGLIPRIISRPGLAADLDTPEDLHGHPGLIPG